MNKLFLNVDKEKWYTMFKFDELKVKHLEIVCIYIKKWYKS